MERKCGRICVFFCTLIFLAFIVSFCGIARAASVVAITSPAAGATVSGQATIAVSSSATVVWVNVYIDGSYLASSPPYSFTWDTTKVANGSHTISVKGYASSGTFLGSASVTVSVVNGASTSTVSIKSPQNGSTVSNTVDVVATVNTSVTWINFYADGKYLGSSPPDNLYWNSASVPDGNHTLSVKAYSSGDSLMGQSSVTVDVQNSSKTTATPTRTPTATATSAHTATPTATSTPKPTATSTPAGGGLAYYVDSVNGSDSNAGTTPGSAWRSLAKVQNFVSQLKPGTSILFARGGTWTGGLELTGVNGAATAPIVFGNYGSGALPIFDGSSSSQYGFHASSGSHVTIDGFEIRNFTYNGVSIHSSGGTMPGWTVQNCNIHNTGPGAYAGGSGPYDDNGYRNQLEFLDFSYSCDGTKFLNNSVSVCGGHNCVQVHGDICNPHIHGNKVSGPWVHNGIDVKAVVGAVVDGNTAHGGAYGACFYIENTQIPAADVTWMQNVCYAANSGFECEGGGVSGHTVTCHLYNNTNYRTVQEPVVTGDGCTQPISWDIRNNIFDTGKDIVYMPYSSCSNRKVTWDYNDDCASMGTCTSLFQGSHDLDGVNPDYLNATGTPPDFHLQTYSPLIGAGETGLTPGDNDIGAY
jgi:hypothetical protein